MRKLFLLALIALTLQFAKADCRIETGKLKAEPQGGNLYKLYLEGTPENTCRPVDSVTVWVGVLCATNGLYESHEMTPTDTLYYRFTSKVILATSVYWWYNGVQVARTDMPAPYIQAGYNSNCFEFIKLEPQAVEAPPVFVPELKIENGQLVSNVGGTLILMSYPDFQLLEVREFQTDFTYSLPVGWVYFYLILSDGTTLGNEVVFSTL